MDISSDKQAKPNTKKPGHSVKKETESLLIPAQNNAIRTNYVKTKIDKMQQNSKCWLPGDRDETIYHKINVAN